MDISFGAIKRQVIARNRVGEERPSWHVVLWHAPTHQIVDSLYDPDWGSIWKSDFQYAIAKCASREEVESFLQERFQALLVTPEEFYAEVEHYQLGAFERKLVSLFKEVHVSSELESKFQEWLMKGIRKFSKGLDIALESSSQVLWGEYLRTPEQHFLFERHQREVAAQKETIQKIAALLNEKHFEDYLHSFGDGYILGKGFKPCKAAVIRYLQKQGAWMEGLFVEDGITADPGRFNPHSRHYTGRPLSIYFQHSAADLEVIGDSVPVPGRIMRFINSKIESRSDSMFLSAEQKQLTAREAREIWMRVQ